MDAAPNVRLRLTNRPENVLLIRQALSGLAEAVGLDAVALNDVSTAVTEAANNVVLHAYEGGEGPLEVEMRSAPGSLEVLVADSGCGIGPALDGGEHISDGIGLPVIQTLSDAVEFRDRPGGGTEVVMHFELSQLHPLAEASTPASAAEPPAGEAETIGLYLAPSEVARNVLPRVLSTVAARAYFSTDRISDAQLLADTLVAEFDRPGAGQLLAEITSAPRSLELRVGPLPNGRADELLAPGTGAGLGSIIARLADYHEVLASGGAELLRLRMAQPR